jgi:hypothetical protein
MANNDDNIEFSDNLPYADENVGDIDESQELSGLEVPEDFNKDKSLTDIAIPSRWEKFKHKLNTMKPLHKTAFGRTLAGRNKTGRMIHSIIDVLPVPNVHEVVKAVVKDADAQDKAMGSYDLLKETFQRLDYFRTGIGVGLVGLYLLDYVSLEKAQRAFEFILSFV